MILAGAGHHNSPYLPFREAKSHSYGPHRVRTTWTWCPHSVRRISRSPPLLNMSDMGAAQS